MPWCLGARASRSGVGFVNYVHLSSAMRAMRALDGAPLSTGGQLHVRLQVRVFGAGVRSF